jgi:hypothetical protein
MLCGIYQKLDLSSAYAIGHLKGAYIIMMRPRGMAETASAPRAGSAHPEILQPLENRGIYSQAHAQVKRPRWECESTARGVLRTVPAVLKGTAR